LEAYRASLYAEDLTVRRVLNAGEGENRLGKILMRAREELRRGETYLALPLGK